MEHIINDEARFLKLPKGNVVRQVWEEMAMKAIEEQVEIFEEEDGEEGMEGMGDSFISEDQDDSFLSEDEDEIDDSFIGEGQDDSYISEDEDETGDSMIID